MGSEQKLATIGKRPHAIVTPLSIRGRIGRPQPNSLPIINLSFNECPFGPSDAVAKAIAVAAKQANRYGDPTCEKLRHALGKRNDLNPDRIVCGNGSEELLDVIGRVFAGPGDEIVIPRYGYIQFSIVANRVGARLVRAPEPEFATDVDALLPVVTERTKIVFLANPNNPTGTMIGEGELQRLADALPSTVVLVIDLAYGEFATVGYCDRVHRLADGRDNVVVTRTFSKAYGLAGLRAGWCHAPERMIPVLYAGRGMGTVNALAQVAALAALDDGETVDRNVAAIVPERDRVASELSAIGVSTLPSCANFLLAKLPGEADSESTDALVEHLFDEAGILVNRTREAGLEHFFRFSLSLPEHNDRLVDCIARFLD